MLKARTDPYNEVIVEATVRGIAIYLDNYSFIRLSQDKSGLRTRFLNLLRRGADLLFSLSNSVEFSGPRGNSLGILREFLDEIGPHWFPLELDPATVVERESQGHVNPFVSEEFLRTYSKERIRKHDGIIDMSSNFFKLSAVTAGWVDSRREPIKQSLARMDRALVAQIKKGRENSRRDPAWLDTTLPAVSFDPRRPATFTYVNLVRQLVTNRGDQLKAHDGIDFCHAVIGASAASVMTLDKHWKRRIEALPQPNRLAKVYYEPQLPDLIAVVENAIDQINQSPSGQAFLEP